MAPTGTYPPDNALEIVMMSGCRPQCSKAKNLPVLPMPVCTSSMTSSVPCSRQAASASCQYSPDAM